MRIDPSRILRVLALAALFTGGAAVLAAQEIVEKEPNNTPGQALTIPLDSIVKGFANEDEEDDDWYALTIPAPGLDALIFELSAVPDEVNRVLRFCDASGKVLSDMDLVGSGEPETLVRLKQAPGKFFINVHTDRGGDTEHAYELKVRRNDRPPATAEEVRRALAKALDFLASTQQEDGSWPDHEIAGAGLAVMAFIGGECAGKDHSARIRAGLDYLKSQFTSGSRFQAGSEEAAIRGGMFGPVSGTGHVRAGHRHAQRHRGFRRARRDGPRADGRGGDRPHRPFPELGPETGHAPGADPGRLAPLRRLAL